MVREHDADGRISLIDSAGGALYDYDDASRLVDVTALSGSSVPSWDHDYDDLDRLLSASRTGQSQAFT